jgi:hypothetical protein
MRKLLKADAGNGNPPPKKPPVEDPMRQPAPAPVPAEDTSTKK